MADFGQLDAAYREYLAAHRSPPGGSLLAQTLATGPDRRRLLPLVPLAPGWRVLDLGTGFGPLAFELAHLSPVDVVGVDVDGPVLEAARVLAATLDGFFAPGAHLRFEAGDATALELPDASFDVVTARLVLQHAPSPSSVASEMCRLLRPGGYGIVVDVDDGLGATWPPRQGPLAVLEDAYDAWQAGYGGDRQIGRKLPSLLAGAGMAVESVVVAPQAAWQRSEPGDLVRRLTASRHLAARAEIAAAGLLAEDEIDRLVDAFVSAPAFDECRIECQVAVVARRPAGGR